MYIDLQVLTADPHRADTSRPHTTRLRCNNRGGERSGATGGGGGEGGDEWGREGGGVKRSGAQRGSVGRAARGCMGGGMEEAATKRAAKGAVRARRADLTLSPTRGMA